MSTIPFYLVTGFLGSGKTSLLRRIINQHAQTKKIAIIQNEFAPHSVDGDDLRLTGKPFTMLEINRGSVFCVCLLSDFRTSLAALVDDQHPDVVILEATGLADPIAVGQILSDENLKSRLFLAHAYCVVDASTFLMLHTTVARIVQQVRIADTVIINKIDKVDKEKLAEVHAKIAEINPFADIITTSYSDIGSTCATVFDSHTQLPVAIRNAAANAQFEACGRPSIASASVRINKPVEKSKIDAFVASWSPKVMRLKGFIRLTDGQTLGIQSSFGDVCYQAITGYSGPSEMVGLGEGLDSKVFASDFDSLITSTV